MNFQKKFIFVEGNISSGKTTFCRDVSKITELKSAEFNSDGILGNFTRTNITNVIFEPVEDARTKYKDEKGKGALQVFYENITDEAFFFQMTIFLLRCKALVEKSELGLNLVDRSFYTDRLVFAETCITKKIQKEVYNDMYNFLIKCIQVPCIGFIYIRCSPEKCFERKNKRATPEENEVPLQYLQDLHEKHEKWLLGLEILNEPSDLVNMGLSHLIEKIENNNKFDGFETPGYVYIIDSNKDRSDEEYSRYYRREFYKAINAFQSKSL